MRYPRVVICSPDEQLALMLRPLAQSERWVVQDFRRPDSAREAIKPHQPTVLLIQADLEAVEADWFRIVPEVLRQSGMVYVIVYAESKISEPQRSNWVANMMSIGVSYVCFPPLTEPVMMDLITGFVGSTTSQFQRSEIQPEAIDLAEEGQADQD